MTISNCLSHPPSYHILLTVVEVNGLEPMASCVQGRRSPNWATPPKKMVGLDGIEPSTSRLSGVRSNRTELQAQ